MLLLNRFKYAVFCLMCSGCSLHHSAEEFNFDALMGKWVNATNQAMQYEEWRATDSEGYAGVGYVIEDGDTTFFESLGIAKVNGVWTYNAGVNGANNGEVIPFTLSRQSQQRIEFRNDGHDFPKKIGYEFISEDELQAYIEGPRDGQTIRILFDFSRSE
jgi:hypothetical protein